MRSCARALWSAWISVVVVAAARADVIYVDAAGKGQFIDLQAAIDASLDGDVLLVRSGTYPGFTIDGRSLTIVADAGAEVQITSTVTIQNTTAVASVVLAGLTIDGAVVYPSSPPGLVVIDNAGHVRLQSCIVRGGMGAPQAKGGHGGHGAAVTNSARVAFSTCTFLGGDGYGESQFIITGGDGGHGVVTQGSAVALYDSWSQGGLGGDADASRPNNHSGDGGDGCQVLDFGILASGCSFQGGTGGTYSLDPGDGGDGLFVLNAQAQLVDNAYAGGAGGWAHYGGPNGANGLPQAGPGLFKHHPGAARTLATQFLAAEQQTLSIELGGEPGDRIWFYSVTAPNFLYVPTFTGILLVSLPPFAAARPAVVLGASGTATVALPLQDIAGTDSVLHFMQGLAVQPDGKARLTSPAHVVVLNCSDLAPDCNTNGECDSCDLLRGLSPDCDKNGEPDECQPDCNTNGVPDACDILNGTSPDLNKNGIPDECEPQMTWYVDALAPPGGNGSLGSPFQTIREGVSIAISGNTVVVASGTYTGPDNRRLDLGGKDLVLRSTGGAATCIVDLQMVDHFARAVSGETSAARIDGFTLRNGRSGNGVLGGAIWIRGSYPTISGCVFEDCQSGQPGGAIRIQQPNPVAGPVVIEHCIFLRCSSTVLHGGAIAIDDALGTPDALVIRNCRFELNVASGFGGGLFASRANTKVSHCTFVDNQANYGGGAALGDSGTNYLDNCLFEGNTAWQYGGALFSSGTNSFTNLTVTGNHVGHPAGAGGGIYFGWNPYYGTTSSLILANSILWHNTTTSGNGKELAIHNAPATMSVERCDVEGGQAGVYLKGGTLNWGPGNIAADPLFLVPGMDHRLAAGSPAIDAGSNALVPPDRTDIDGDGNTTEPVPLDLGLLPRFIEDPAAPNTGVGPPPIVDMGAHERQV